MNGEKLTFKYAKNKRRSLVKFANGVPESKSSFETKLMEKESSDERLLHAKSDNLAYLGSNIKCQGQNFVVCEVDESSGKVEVFDVDFYTMKPLIKSLFTTVEESTKGAVMPKDANKNNSDERTYSEKQDDLTDVFGSHKRKRAMAARIRNKVVDNMSVIQESVETVLKSVDTSQLDDTMLASNSIEASNTILPCNQSATDVKQAYSLQQLIPEQVSRSLIDVSKHLLNLSNADALQMMEDGVPHYVVNHAKSPPRNVVGNTQLHQEYVCCLQLFRHLVTIYKMRASESKSSKLFEEEPPAFRKWALSEFFLGEGRQRKMPQRLKDKAIAIALVLAWNIDSFSSDSELLRRDFQVSQRKLNMIVRALGGSCKVSKAGGERREITTLQLPLKFPIISTVRSGRK